MGFISISLLFLPFLSLSLQFTLIPPKATSYHEVQLALCHCNYICTLLSHQPNTFDNSEFILLFRLFCVIIKRCMVLCFILVLVLWLWL